MKRSELNVGDELYYSRSQDWRCDSCGAAKAVVVDTAGYRTLDRWHRQRVGGGDPWRRAEGGTHVLVDVHPQSPGGRVYRTVVPLAHLRGPWTELYEQASAREAAQRRRQEQDDAAQREAAIRREAATARAHKLGVDARSPRDVTWGPDKDRFVAVSVEQLNQLLDLLEQRTTETEQP